MSLVIWFATDSLDTFFKSGNMARLILGFIDSCRYSPSLTEK
jgi:hypothetical protein